MFSQKVKKNAKQFHQSVQWKSRVVCLLFLFHCFITLSAFGQGNWEDNTSNPQTWTTGNVGIGTPSPWAKLEVVGDGSGWQKGFIFIKNNNRDAGIRIFDSYFTVKHHIYNKNSDGDKLRIAPNGSFNSGGLTLTQNGYVGIGTTNPGDKLEVKGNNSTTGLRVAWGSQYPALFGEFKHAGSGGLQINANANGGWADMSLQTDGITRLFIRDNGNVGIGTTQPQATLEIKDNGSPTLFKVGRKLKVTDDQDGQLILYDEDDDPEIILHAFKTSYINKELVVGSSTITPAAELHVVGNGVISGNVGIGTENPQSKLAVNGRITCTEVEVTLNGWSDFVFADDYQLMPLEAVEQHIQKNKHLPDIPSEKEVLENGLGLGEMQAKLLQKVEELTLYMIELKKENEVLKDRISVLEK